MLDTIYHNSMWVHLVDTGLGRTMSVPAQIVKHCFTMCCEMCVPRWEDYYKRNCLRSPDPIANRRTRFCGASSSRFCSATWTMESTILRSRSCLCKTDSCLVLFKTLPTTLPTYTTLVWCWRQSVTHIIATKQGCSPTPQVQWYIG